MGGLARQTEPLSQTGLQLPPNALSTAGRAGCSLRLPWPVARDVKIRQEKSMFRQRKPKTVHKSHLCFLLLFLGTSRKESTLRKKC